MKIRFKGYIIVSVLLIVLFFCVVSIRAEVVAVYGDSRTDHATHEKVIKAIGEFNPVLILHSGDYVEDPSSREDWRRFLAITDKIRQEAEFFPATGNHDKDSPFYRSYFPELKGKRWFSRDRFGVHFVVLDSTASFEPGSVQYDWLKKDLARAKKSFKVIILHYPFFSTVRDELASRNLREYILPLLEEYEVGLVFSGHDHNYQRFLHKNTQFIVTGGGGASLHNWKIHSFEPVEFRKDYNFCILDIGEENIEITVYALSGDIIEEINIVLD